MLNRRTKKGKADPAIYADLRAQVLNLDPADAGLQATEVLPDVWGVVLETGLEEGSYTLVALADGTTSLYLSSGGGTIGAGEHDQVEAATKALVEAAQRDLDQFSPTPGQDLPTAGQTVIRVMTYDGQHVIEAAESDLGEGRHPQSDLFYKAHDIITQVRLIEEQRG